MPNINDYYASLLNPGDDPNGTGLTPVKNPNIDFGSSGAPGSSNATPSGIGLTPMASPFLDTGTGLPTSISSQPDVPVSAPAAASSPSPSPVATPATSPMVQLTKGMGVPVGTLGTSGVHGVGVSGFGTGPGAFV